jgi:predicted nucleic acid-binding protein
LKQQVYIETTIPSFYFEVRQQPEMVARRNWTRSWWDVESNDYELVTSLPVIEELQQGGHPRKKETLSLISDLPVLPIKDEIYRIVEEYVANQLMPKDPRGDAIHLAIASYHRCQYLLTWNCSHLANANKFEHIRHINTMLGLFVPVLTTPAELLRWQKE